MDIDSQQLRIMFIMISETLFLLYSDAMLADSPRPAFFSGTGGAHEVPVWPFQEAETAAAKDSRVRAVPSLSWKYCHVISASK